MFSSVNSRAEGADFCKEDTRGLAERYLVLEAPLTTAETEPLLPLVNKA